jgi:hypothetical protein
MELKWLAIMMIGLFGSMFIGLGFESYYHQQCRITAIQASMPVEQIEKVCK